MSKKPKGCITVEEARELQKNYVDKIEKTLEKSLGCQECREFWWSIDELEKYIKYVKKKAKKKGYKNLGLRFYLGKYGKHQHEHEHVTMFMTPTGVLAKESLTPIVGEVVGAKSASVDKNIEKISAFNRGSGGVKPYDN